MKRAATWLAYVAFDTWRWIALLGAWVHFIFGGPDARVTWPGFLALALLFHMLAADLRLPFLRIKHEDAADDFD